MEKELAILKALSDSNRMKILDLLLHNDYCVGALALKLDLSEPAVSQHLKVLRQAGIVTGVKRGYYTHYDVNPEPLRQVASILVHMAVDEHNRKPCKLNETGDQKKCSLYVNKQKNKREQNITQT